jgi:hypothetical protein
LVADAGEAHTDTNPALNAKSAAVRAHRILFRDISGRRIRQSMTFDVTPQLSSLPEG